VQIQLKIFHRNKAIKMKTMIKKIPILYFIFFSKIFFGQTVTIAQQNFDVAGLNYTVTGTAWGTGTTVPGANNPTAPRNAGIGGSTGFYYLGNANVTLTFDNVDTRCFSNITLSFRTAGYSVQDGLSGSGSLGGADGLIVSVSSNGGTNWSQEAAVNGNNDSYWGWERAAELSANTAYDGNNSIEGAKQFNASGGGATSGYTSLTLTGLPSVQNLRIRIQFSTSTSDELMPFDNFIITGTPITIPATIASSATVCQNAASPVLTFSSTATAASGPYTFSYTLNGTTTQTIITSGATNSVNFNVPTSTFGTSTYSLTGISNNIGCQSSASGSANIVVKGLPSASITGTATKCLNDVNPVITFVGNNGATPFVFSYNINGAATQTLTSDAAGTGAISAPTSSAGTFTYNLVGVQEGSSTSCSQAQTGSAVVTINPLGATLAGTTTVCLNAAQPAISFTGSGGTTSYIFTYNINNTGNITVTSNGAGVATVTAPTNSAGNFVYTLISVQDDNSLSCISSSSVAITVYALPTATVASNVTVCQNGAMPAITFSATGGSSPYTFSYTLNGGAVQTVSSIVGSNTATVSASTNSVNNFIYALTNVQEGSIAGCSQAQTGNATITVRAPSQGTVTSSTTRVCQNSTSPNIVFSGSVGTAPYIFYYSTNITVSGTTTHSVLSTGNTATVPVPTNIADTLVYTITNIQDASGFACGIGGSFDSVIVDPLPLSTITANLNDVCLGDPDQTITFTGIGVPAPVIFNYFTSVNGGANQAQPALTSIAPLLTATIAAPATTLGTTVYTNGISSSNVCTGGGNGSARLTVNPIPTASLSLTGSSTICQSGGASQVTFTGNVGRAPFIFSYNIDGAATQTISTLPNQNSVALPLTNLPAGTHTINLLAVKDTFNCAQAQIGSVTILVDPMPTASAGGSNSICMNGTATVIGTSAANGSINWTYNGSGTLTNSTTPNPTYAANPNDAKKAITLTMTVTSTNSCNPQTATATYTVTVDSLPLAIAGGISTICQGTSKTITGTYSQYGSVNWTHNGQGTINNQTTLNPIYNAVVGDAGNTVTLTMTVTSTNSCLGQTATANYSIYVDPLPTATSQGAQTICENTTATVSGATAANGSIIWTENGQGSITGGVNSLTPTYTSTTGDAGNRVTLTMTVTSTNTCVGQTATTTYTVNVDRLPTATSAKNATICQGTSYQLQNGEATMSNAIVQSWISNGQGTLSNANTLTPTYTSVAGDATNAVVLTLTVISNNTCSPATATATYTIHLDPLPVAISGGNHTMCQSASYALQNGEATISNATVQSWISNGQGILSNINSLMPTYIANAGDAGNAVTLTLTAVSNNRCSTRTDTAIYTIHVDPLPRAVAAVAQTICQGASTTLSGASASNGIINWTTNGQGTLTSQTALTPQYQASAADAGNTVILTMAVTSTNTCASATTSTTTAIRVRPTLKATLAAQQSVCQNSPAQVVFEVTSSGTPPYTFTYSEDGIKKTETINTSNSVAISAPTNTPKKIIYNLINIQDANCTEPITINTQTVTVNPLPDATISKDEDVCRDSTANDILLAGYNGTKPYSFTFNINNSGAIVTTGDSVPIQPNTSKSGSFIYTLTQVKDANGCVQILNKKVVVEVHENPLAIFTINPESTTILESTIEVKDASISTMSWIWDFGDGSILFSPKPESHTYADTGTFRIKLIAQNSICKDSTYQTVRITLPLLLYIPNTFTPNNDGVNDIFKPEGDGVLKFEMMIFDRWGNLIFNTDDINKGWDGKANGGSEIAQIDTYVYLINLRALSNKHDYTYRGIVNLIK
jgi:gliding motility-associated-like protein